MTDSLDFLIRRDDFMQTRWAEAELRADSALEPGDVLLRIDRRRRAGGGFRSGASPTS